MPDDLLTRVRREHAQRLEQPSDDHASDVTAGGSVVSLADAETVLTGDEDTFLTSGKHGRPRGRDAIEAREVGQTWPMELIKNAIIDQITGGDLVFPSDDEDIDQAEAELQALVRDLLNGPHLMDDDFDDLVSAAVSDMTDVGNGYWEVIPPTDESLPWASLKPVDALTVRHDIDADGSWNDPPYWQAPYQTMTGSALPSTEASPTSLDREQLVVMKYPNARRTYEGVYPKPPAMQVRDVLELLINSTTHHNRFYNDNEIPAGFLQVMGEGQEGVDQIQEKIQQASGDPRKAPVIGGEGNARWIEMQGTSINLDVIEEQKWFFQLCLAAFGLSRQELNMVEDVNRSTSEGQLDITLKRVAKPIAKKITSAIRDQLLPQFDVYQALDSPFDVKLEFSDPAQERQREKHLRQRYQAGALTYNEYRRQLGDDPDDTEVVINGEVVDYGEYPLHVVETLLRDARGDPEPPEDTGSGVTDAA